MTCRQNDDIDQRCIHSAVPTWNAVLGGLRCLQGIDQLLVILEPILRALCDHAFEHLALLVAKQWAVQGWRWLRALPHQQIVHAGALKRRTTREQVVKRQSQRVDIASGVHLFALRLLR